HADSRRGSLLRKTRLAGRQAAKIKRSEFRPLRQAVDENMLVRAVQSAAARSEVVNVRQSRGGKFVAITRSAGRLPLQAEAKFARTAREILQHKIRFGAGWLGRRGELAGHENVDTIARVDLFDHRLHFLEHPFLVARLQRAHIVADDGGIRHDVQGAATVDAGNVDENAFTPRVQLVDAANKIGRRAYGVSAEAWIA